MIVLELAVVNLVATADLGQPVDLVAVSRLEHVIFDQDVYGGRVAYLKAPCMFGKVNIFFSGKMISVGTRGEDEARHDLEYTRDLLVDEGVVKPVELVFITRNIVAILVLDHVDLEALADELGAVYEPEQFPAAIYKIENPNTTFLIFSSGKIVILGAKSLAHLNKAAESITEVIRKYSY